MWSLTASMEKGAISHVARVDLSDTLSRSIIGQDDSIGLHRIVSHLIATWLRRQAS
jgi:hypothetical protein